MPRPARSFYQQLLSEFEGPAEAECFKIAGKKGRPFRGTCSLLEYLWPSVFGEEALLNPKHTMIHGG